MQTVWTEFSHGVVTAWKKAEESIAQGIGWIIAKMEGLDPNEMAKTIAEDYITDLWRYDLNTLDYIYKSASFYRDGEKVYVNKQL